MVSWGRLVLASSVVLLAGCTTTTSGATPTAGAATTASTATACAARVETGSLPDWADAGFSGGDARFRLLRREG